MIMSPHHGVAGGGGDIVFSADPDRTLLMNRHILAKLTQIYHWEGEKC